jgi:hypothetical protein
MKLEPVTGLFAVVDPQGNIVHTTIRTQPEESILEWMNVEQSMQWIKNMGRKAIGQPYGPAPSWEGYEAQGYRIVPVEVHYVPEATNATHV